MDVMEKDTILVPVDFSDVAYFAMDHALSIARNFGHKLVLLHVLAKKDRVGLKKQEAEDKLSDFSAKLSRVHDLKVSYLVRQGNIYTTISELADELHAAFIVMGVQGEKGAKHLAGSYAYRVVCCANAPVLVVKNHHHHLGFRNIVVPIDFSKRSVQKVAQAVKFARYFHAKIRVFGFLSSQNKAKIINKEALLKSVNDFFEENGVKVSAHLVVKPGMDWPEALILFAQQVDADLIMIVAERGGRIQDLFSTNHTERILDAVHIPVLTIVPGSADLAVESKSAPHRLLTPFVDPFGFLKQPGITD